MSQGIIVDVRDIVEWNLRNTRVEGGGGLCITDNSGCWCYTRSGHFTVYATHTGYIDESQSVYVDDDHWTNVYFTESAGHAMQPSITGVVHTESDEPLSGMFVWGAGTQDNVKYWGCYTNSAGIYSLPIHSAGEYIIYCGKNNYELISHGNYSQSSSTPTSTTTINFTGNYAAVRIGNDNPKLAVHNRSVMVLDDLGRIGFYVADEPNTDTVYAKTRTLNGYLNTYIRLSSDEEVLDGYGGSQYE